jgi:hypothetical protein
MRRPEPVGLGDVAVRVIGELAGSVAHHLDEILPAEARLHLIRAQRELLLAAVATLEHHQEQPPREPKSAKRPDRRRVRKISLD